MNKDKIQDRYLDIIDSVSLKEFEGFSLRQILFNETFYAQNMSRKSVMSRLISTLFFAQADFVVKNEGNDILFFSQVYGRADHDGYWSKMKGLFQCFDEVQISFLRKKDILRRFSLKGLGEKIAKYKKFYKALNGIENSTHRMSLAQALLETYLFGKKLEGWQLSPSLCMCFLIAVFMRIMQCSISENRALSL